MKFLTMTAKVAFSALFAAAIGFGSLAHAGERGINEWLFGSGSQSGDSGINSNVASGKGGGKAVTKTEVFAGKSVAPMVFSQSDRLMADAVSQYEIAVSRGGWPQVGGSRLAKGSSGPDVVKLRQRLVAEAYLPPDALSAQDPQEYSDAVVTAVAQFQANHGLGISGKVDKATAAAMNVSAAERLATLRANVARIREYSKDLGPRYIIVNIPALQLEAVNFNSVYSRHNIIAGQPSRPTPVTLTHVSDINFNPYWNAPVSIVEKDIIPRIRREGTGFLRDNNMRIYDGYNGPEVNPKDVDWDNVPPNRFFFRQDPGAENPMAGVKINFPSPFGIYLHDTPVRSLFTTGSRYLSSGCVRVDEVQILVNWILNGQDGWNPSRIEQIMAAHEERLDVKVADGPQLRTMYLTAWPTPSGTVNFRDDIYGLDGTGFVVGQPMPSGEYSDDGQRFVLKPIERQAAASVDDADYFKPRRASRGFDLFGSWRQRDSDSPRLLPSRRDDAMSGFSNFSQPEPAKKNALKVNNPHPESGKKKAQKKKTLLPALADKSVDKTGKVASPKKKVSPAADSTAGTKKKTETVAAVATGADKPSPAAPIEVKKKKKKVEEASAPAASSSAPAQPIFTQQ